MVVIALNDQTEMDAEKWCKLLVDKSAGRVIARGRLTRDARDISFGANSGGRLLVIFANANTTAEM